MNKIATLFYISLLAFAVLAPLVPAKSQGLRVDAMVVWKHFDYDYKNYDPWFSLLNQEIGEWYTPAGLPAQPIAVLPGDDMDPNVAFNRSGYAMAVWANNMTGSYEIMFATFNLTTQAWSDPMFLTELEDGDDLDPDIAFDTNGWAICIWVHKFYENGTQVIYYSLWNGTAWIGPNSALVPLPNGWGGQAGIPELCFITKASSDRKNVTDHEAVAVWTDWSEESSQYHAWYAIWRGYQWTDASYAPAVKEIPGQTEDADHELYPLYNSEPRMGVSADSNGFAKAVWSAYDYDTGQYQVWSSEWDSASDQWILLQAYDYGFWPSVAFDFLDLGVSVYSHQGAEPPYSIDIWYNREENHEWSPSFFAADSGWKDYRPAIAAKKTSVFVSVWYAFNETSADYDLYWAEYIGGSWTPAQELYPGGLFGDDFNPELATPIMSPHTPVIPEIPTFFLAFLATLATSVFAIKRKR